MDAAPHGILDHWLCIAYLSGTSKEQRRCNEYLAGSSFAMLLHDPFVAETECTCNKFFLFSLLYTWYLFAV
jgi:hypothetical protein